VGNGDKSRFWEDIFIGGVVWCGLTLSTLTDRDFLCFVSYHRSETFLISRIKECNPCIPFRKIFSMFLFFLFTLGNPGNLDELLATHQRE
jgi:hypothetical protein